MGCSMGETVDQSKKQLFVRISETLNHKGYLIPRDDYEKTLVDGFESETDHYHSVYFYNEDHEKTFKEKGTISGITDVVTDKLIFDFDNEKDVESARQDTITAVSRLKNMGVQPDDIDLYFSGLKGFTVIVKLDRFIKPDEHAHVALEVVGKGLATIDASVYNPSRVLRVPNTKHPTSKLYKVKLSHYQLSNFNVDKIKALANSPKTFTPTKPVTLNPNVFVLPEKPKKEKKHYNMEVGSAPRHWKDYKWKLLNAEGLEAGERHNAMMVVAATCRGLGYNRDITEAMLNTFDGKYAEVTKQDRDEVEVERSLDAVFADNWNGGQFSVEKNKWLQKYCERVGIKPQEEKLFLNINDLHHSFNDFALNFDKNLIKTGIPELDKHTTFLTSTHNGVLGKPGAGKTSFMLQWLAHTNEQDINSICYSLDMSRQTIYGKMLQAVSGYSFTGAVEKFKQNDKWVQEQVRKIQDRWGKVDFNFKSGVTVDMIKDDIKRQEDKTGNKTRLLMIDYLECLQSKYSDPSTGSGLISNELKDLASELEVCSVLLLQSQKHSTSEISDPLLSMKFIKGSSLIEQSLSTILTLWREGYDPKTVADDKFISFAVVKNRFGGLWTDDFSWEGLRGSISDITDEGREHIKELRERKKKMKADEAGEDPWK